MASTIVIPTMDVETENQVVLAITEAKADIVALQNVTTALNSGTATSTAGAATVNKRLAVITTEALTTAAGSAYVFTLTNSQFAVGDAALVQVLAGTRTTGTLEVTSVVITAGQAVITFTNRHASVAFNGTLIFAVKVEKAS